jgi:hypothetical protein
VPAVNVSVDGAQQEDKMIALIDDGMEHHGYYHQSDPGIIIQSDPPKLSTRLIA